MNVCSICNYFLCSYIFELLRYCLQNLYTKKVVHIKIFDVAAYQKHVTILSSNLLAKQKTKYLVNSAKFLIFFSLELYF